ncbi:MAG: hypothetical protein COW03_14810 [Cytophagales bacterium CG12_big_fil_rev_8_21_14_0_65_40_12]|nr:MAG: hypothetical protein COW03_14810 [Cytophagales bacterium CG12_big_fil_rev_8_21_14_0_65_40_12]PIW04244.1 MAG: hypothetical protein COW40_10970 [Cytophagales bacterium CG17_big_fil_post_rev_8_21_14_2_50_40_13]
MNFKDYYNEHEDYIALRKKGSAFEKQYYREVDFWKNKYLVPLLDGHEIQTICEVGCAVGILLNRFGTQVPMNKRYGVDISSSNIEYAKELFPEMNFFAGRLSDFLVSTGAPPKVDLVILSDILEHVEDDSGLLQEAGDYGKLVVLNLPMEKCEENKDRVYGIEDKHGHLRSYDLADARQLVESAGMEEVACTVKHYVQEPIFREYLADKLFNNKETTEEKLGGIAKYLNEINEIDLNPSFYKSNYYALLRKKV